MSWVEYVAHVHEEGGSLWSEVVDLPGCFASGDSLDELREALEEAIALYLRDGLQGPAGSVRRRLRVLEMRVSVPA